MNITGSVYFPHINNAAGLFTAKSNDWKFAYDASTNQPIYWGAVSFDASREWTGEINKKLVLF